MIRHILTIAVATLIAAPAVATEKPYYCGTRFVTFPHLDEQGAATFVRTVRKDAFIRIEGHASGKASVTVRYGKGEASYRLPAGTRAWLVGCLN